MHKHLRLVGTAGAVLMISVALAGSASAVSSTSANDPGVYDPSGVSAPSANGNGDGNATGRPAAGSVGNADAKNPHGQLPDATDGNNGYECDGNNGIGQTNPAHSGCGADIPG